MAHIKEFGDSNDLIIRVKYEFDGKVSEFGFDLDYSGNAKNWIWDDDFEYEDESDLQYILREAICGYLNEHYI